MAAETLRVYATTWLATIKPTVRHTSLRAYEQSLRVRAFPSLGDIPIDQITRPQLKVWFVAMLEKYKPGTAAHALVTLHTLLAAAVEEEILPKNPASCLRRALRGALREKRSAFRPPMTREQLKAFLEAAKEDRQTYHGMVLLAFAGLRLGEVVGLQWVDVDIDRKVIYVRRQVYQDGSVSDLKTSAGRRDIPMAEQLRGVLRSVCHERTSMEAKYGLPGSPWVLFPDLGHGFTGNMARKAMEHGVKRALKTAGLPGHFSCHSLRHTIATLLLEEGANLKFVQRFLGHAAISITADRYGWSAQMTDPESVRKVELSLGTFGLLTPPEKSA